MINVNFLSLFCRFLLQDHVRQLDLNFVAVKDQNKLSRENDDDVSEGPPKKKLKGQNKHRPREKRVPKCEKLCFKIGTEGSCPNGDSCCFSHDVASYLAKKPPDIGEKCYLYETFGKCPYSFSCRFGSHHIKDGENLVINELWEECKNKNFYFNTLQRDVQISLRKREYNFQKSNDAMKKFNTLYDKINWNETKNIDSSKVENATVVDVSNDATISVEIEKDNNQVRDEIEKGNNQVSVETEKGNNQVSVETEPAVFVPKKKKVVIILCLLLYTYH